MKPQKNRTTRTVSAMAVLVALNLFGGILWPGKTLAQSTSWQEIAPAAGQHSLPDIERRFQQPVAVAVASSNVFSRMDKAEQADYFKRMPALERKKIFLQLDVQNRSELLSRLDENTAMDLLAQLTENEKEAVFAGLPSNHKAMLFDTLAENHKQVWLSKYPELAAMGKQLPAAIKPTPSPAAAKTTAPSPIESALSGQFPTVIESRLAQFGYEYFQSDRISFTPLENVPVGEDYLIGPGDNFTIQLWGKVEESYQATVDRNGQITLPRIGTVSVAGMTFGQLNAHLKQRLSEFYPDFQISISMGRLRTIDIFLVGEAVQPGTYSVSSLSTLITALFASGGPNKTGSLRNIALVRNGQTIKTVDLYGFFLKGDKQQDERLMPGDTIVIPVIGPVVGVSGNVKRPAIYEIKKGQTIADAIGLAGGVLPFGRLQNIVVERIHNHQRRIAKNFNLDDPASASTEMTTALADGDLIKVFPVHKKLRNVVYLEGHVKYPREYEFRPGMKVRDLIGSYEALLPEPYLNQAEIVRQEPPDYQTRLVQFDLARMLDGDENQNLPLQDLDKVVIYHKWEKTDIPMVEINGEIRNPGKYRLFIGMTVKDLIFAAGNLTEKADPTTASLTRIVPGTKGADSIEISFSPRQALAGVIPDNGTLERNDSVFIREIPKYSESIERKVVLAGEFKFPGVYSFSEGERLDSVIRRAGGLNDFAYKNGAVFTREAAKTTQKERLVEYADKLEQEILSLSVKAAELATEKETAQALQQALQARKELLGKVRAAEPTGRLIINLSEVLVKSTSDNNLHLRPGDRLVVKDKPEFVNVLGEVFNPGAVVSIEGRRVGYYLDKVGGTTGDADGGQLYLVKADGSVISKQQDSFFGLVSWDLEARRWTIGGFDRVPVEAGDTIIVPKRLVRYAWLPFVRGITEVLYHIAVAAGVVHNITE